MKILLVSSEVVPFAKTGGLADVAGSLPIELAKLGHDVRVAMPKYRCVDDKKFKLRPILQDIHVHLSTNDYIAKIKKTSFPGTKVPVYFVQNEAFFGRDGLYQAGGQDYADNAERFAFFCKAVIWLLKGLKWIPDIIHCNDWQTALIPVYLRTAWDMKQDPDLTPIRILYTIHNLGYQGQFDPSQAPRIDIGPELFHPSGLEFYGNLNLMKGGLVFADEISTVSPSYAREIQTPEYGNGLEGVLVWRSHHLRGIMNGIDESVWNPAKDALIPARYTPSRLAGKQECKAALQAQCGLPQRPDVPLFGIISRLDKQKGFDLIEKILTPLLSQDVQLVLLGTGAPQYHRLFQRVAKKCPEKTSINLTFDNTLAHRIEAGSDIFLMPSHYEPCGLNQLYSMKYGTIPVVRKTGGLADSVTDATPEALKSGQATGFVFEKYAPKPFSEAITRALACYARKADWRKLMKNAMAKDFSWSASAKKYEQLFRQMVGQP